MPEIIRSLAPDAANTNVLAIGTVFKVSIEIRIIWFNSVGNNNTVSTV